MALTITDILSAIAGCLDATTQAILAMSFGFAMIPSALAYAVGIVGCLAFNSVVPISFQAETITLGGTIGRNKQERVSIIFLGGLIMTMIGALGLLQTVVDFAGEDVICAMMSGVGIILAKAAMDLVKENVRLGTISMIVAILVYAMTMDLVYTIVAGVVVTSLVACFLKEKVEVGNVNESKFKLQKLTMNFTVLRGALSVICLTIGGNIAYGGITADIAGTTANVDHISIYSGVADCVSSIFGGSPVSVIISATAATPNPKWAAILLMGIMMVILLAGVLPKIAKFVPVQAIAGTLFVLGVFVTVPENALLAFSGNDPLGTLSCGTTLAVTAVTDPFFGILAGIAVKLLAVPFGMV